MSKNEADSTVLLLAVIAAAAACSLIAPGHPWFCGAGGITILLILFAYDLEGIRSFLQSLAFAGACGLGFAVAIIPISPFLFSVPSATDPSLGGKWIPIFWAAGTVLFFVIDRARMGGRVATERQSGAGSMARISPVSTERFEPQQSAFAPPMPRAAPVPQSPPAAAQVSQPVLVRADRVVAPPEPVLPPLPPAAPAAPPPVAAAPIPLPAGKETAIYVNLTGEGLNLLRSVRAEHLGRDFYRIIDSMPADETWEYPPGSVVRCKKKSLSSGKALVAYEEAPRAQ